MGILSCASNASAWRGYEYYESKKVISWKKINEEQYEGYVKGNSAEAYRVIIDVKHPRKNSSCNCPYADGKKIICKHQVALLFTAFPQEAKNYIEEIEEYEREEERQEQEAYNNIVKYVNSLSKEELRVELINALTENYQRDDYW